jgi:hypothetical protein
MEIFSWTIQINPANPYLMVVRFGGVDVVSRPYLGSFTVDA